MAKYPAPNGVQSTGTSSERARLDHVHPSDPSKANVKDLARVALTGSYTDLKNIPEPPTAPVTSVNNKVGAVVLDADDVGALPDDTFIPEKTSDLTNDSGFITSVPVTSVNNKTGAVVLGASDVGALSDGTAIPAKTSDLTNDSGFITLSDVPEVIYDIPAEFHAETSDHYFTFASGISASTILSALNVGKLPVVRNDYGSLKRRWYYSDYNNDGNDIYIQFFRETQFSREVMLYTESDAKAYIDSVSLSSFQRKPVTVWEVDGTTVTEGLKALQTDIAEMMNWQLTGLNLSPYKRIKVYSKGGQGQTNAGTTGAMILEMSLDPRMAIATKGGHYVGSVLSQKPNDANRYASLTCAVSADKTSFAVLRQTSLYGTAATTNNDIGADVVLIEGYYD